MAGLKPKHLLVRTYYHCTVDKRYHPFGETKMKTGRGYLSVTYNDPWHGIYIPVGNNRYVLPDAYGTHKARYHENILVNYVWDNIYEKKTNPGLTGGGIDDLFQDRLGLIRSKIELILLLLDERKRISQEVIYQMDSDTCKVQSLIFEMGPRAYQMNRERLSLEQTKLDLEEEKRREEVSLFRDTGLLNQDLRDTLIQYLSEVQKSKLISMEEEK